MRSLHIPMGLSSPSLPVLHSRHTSIVSSTETTDSWRCRHTDTSLSHSSFPRCYQPGERNPNLNNQGCESHLEGWLFISRAVQSTLGGKCIGQYIRFTLRDCLWSGQCKTRSYDSLSRCLQKGSLGVCGRHEHVQGHFSPWNSEFPSGELSLLCSWLQGWIKMVAEPSFSCTVFCRDISN